MNAAEVMNDTLCKIFEQMRTPKIVLSKIRRPKSSDESPRKSRADRQRQRENDLTARIVERKNVLRKRDAQKDKKRRIKKENAKIASETLRAARFLAKCFHDDGRIISNHRLCVHEVRYVKTNWTRIRELEHVYKKASGTDGQDTVKAP